MAKQLDLFSMPLPSPCIGVCRLNQKGYCEGCFRTRDERFHWLQLSDMEKKNVIRLCQQRKKRFLTRKGGTLTDELPEQLDLFDENK